MACLRVEWVSTKGNILDHTHRRSIALRPHDRAHSTITRSVQKDMDQDGRLTCSENVLLLSAGPSSTRIVRTFVGGGLEIEMSNVIAGAFCVALFALPEDFSGVTLVPAAEAIGSRFRGAGAPVHFFADAFVRAMYVWTLVDGVRAQQDFFSTVTCNNMTKQICCSDIDRLGNRPALQINEVRFNKFSIDVVRLSH